ncbi:MFS transporter [Clostridium thermarum]|uniref:MFS transporter n=1 Tax=Clostridium thermarum TaxID=1716543 RepID=UPI0013D67C5F|nr:MFS transporter [Clostridium thermarum]
MQLRLANKLRKIKKSDNNMLLFAFEGVLITLINNLINNNNNLFATRLGASDFQLSLLITIPQIVGMLVLIPGSILTDRMINKKRMVVFSLSVLVCIYGAIGFVPMLGKHSFTGFLILLAISVGPMTMYNTSWQAYFSDVIPLNKRNHTFTLRTKWTFLVGVATPLVTGFLLASVSTVSGKITLHRIFFWVSCVFLLLQIAILKRISGGNSHSQSGTIGFKDLKVAALDMLHNKKLLGFIGVSLFFHMAWQSDWTMYYIGQVNYLKLNEAWLSYVTVGGAAVQFLTVGFWSRINERYGVRFSIIFGGFGLCLFPLNMILSTSLPDHIGPTVFLLMGTLANFAFATVSLNLMQCLLQVVPDKNKTLSIAIYALLIALSNAVMPLAGVKLYTALGANLNALHITFIIIFIGRVIAACLWTFRWWLLRREPK